MRLSLATTVPFDACTAIQRITAGGNISSIAPRGTIDGIAYLSSIYSCHFIYKTIYAEAHGASLEIVGNAADQLFYMAAAEERCEKARTLAAQLAALHAERAAAAELTRRLEAQLAALGQEKKMKALFWSKISATAACETGSSPTQGRGSAGRPIFPATRTRRWRSRCARGQNGGCGSGTRWTPARRR